jgi:hypothetical protein
MVLLIAPASLAQTQSPTDAELAAARTLFGEVRELQRQGRWAEALPKLEAIGKVRMTPQVRFHIALCMLHTGKLVAARNGFELALREARAEDAEQVIQESSDHIASLEVRIPTLHIKLATQPSGLTVHIGEDSIQTGLLTVPIPLDPGTHRIRVSAPDHRSVESNVHLDEGMNSELLVVLEPMASEPAPTSSSALSPIAPRSPKPKDDNTLGWLLLGTGGAMIAGATVSAVVRSKAISDIDDACPSHRDCDPSLKDTRDRAQTYGTLSVVLAGLGAVALGAGGYVLWASGSREDDVALSLRPEPHGLGMSGVVTW